MATTTLGQIRPLDGTPTHPQVHSITAQAKQIVVVPGNVLQQIAPLSSTSNQIKTRQAKSSENDQKFVFPPPKASPKFKAANKPLPMLQSLSGGAVNKSIILVPAPNNSMVSQTSANTSPNQVFHVVNVNNGGTMATLLIPVQQNKQSSQQVTLLANNAIPAQQPVIRVIKSPTFSQASGVSVLKAQPRKRSRRKKRNAQNESAPTMCVDLTGGDITEKDSSNEAPLFKIDSVYSLNESASVDTELYEQDTPNTMGTESDEENNDVIRGENHQVLAARHAIQQLQALRHEDVDNGDTPIIPESPTPISSRSNSKISPFSLNKFSVNFTKLLGEDNDGYVVESNDDSETSSGDNINFSSDGPDESWTIDVTENTTSEESDLAQLVQTDYGGPVFPEPCPIGPEETSTVAVDAPEPTANVDLLKERYKAQIKPCYVKLYRIDGENKIIPSQREKCERGYNVNHLHDTSTHPVIKNRVDIQKDHNYGVKDNAGNERYRASRHKQRASLINTRKTILNKVTNLNNKEGISHNTCNSKMAHAGDSNEVIYVMGKPIPSNASLINSACNQNLSKPRDDLTVTQKDKARAKLHSILDSMVNKNTILPQGKGTTSDDAESDSRKRKGQPSGAVTVKKFILPVANQQLAEHRRPITVSTPLQNIPVASQSNVMNSNKNTSSGAPPGGDRLRKVVQIVQKDGTCSHFILQDWLKDSTGTVNVGPFEKHSLQKPTHDKANVQPDISLSKATPMYIQRSSTLNTTNRTLTQAKATHDKQRSTHLQQTPTISKTVSEMSEQSNHIIFSSPINHTVNTSSSGVGSISNSEPDQQAAPPVTASREDRISKLKAQLAEQEKALEKVRQQRQNNIA